MIRPAKRNRVRPSSIGRRGWRRFISSGARWALLAGFLVGGGTFVALQEVPPTYRASAWLLAPQTAPDGAGLDLITPPPIDPGIYRAAVTEGPVAAEALTSLLGHPPTPEALRVFRKHTRVDVERRSISSVIRVRASSVHPLAAQRAADALANALLAWDTQRARTAVSNSVNALRRTIVRIDADLASGTRGGRHLSDAARADLVELRAALERELRGARNRSASLVIVGLLEPLAMAVLPDHPSSPDVPLGTLIASIAGMALGLALFFARWHVDPRVRGRAQLTDLARAPVLAEFPLTSSAPSRTWHEAANMLRSQVLFAAGKQGTYVLAVTSPSSAAEKAQIAIGAAASLVRAGYRTLLVDADLRSPHLTETLGARGAETAPFATQLEHPSLDYSPAIVAVEGDRTCDFVPGGHGQHHAAGLLERALPMRLRSWKRRYDYIVLDCTPVLPFADTLAIARHCSGVVVCVPSMTSTPAEITETTRLLRSHQAAVLGTVLTGADVAEGPRSRPGFPRASVRRRARAANGRSTNLRGR